MSKIKILSKDTCRSLISRDRIGWKVTLTITLNEDVIWVQPNMVNMNGMDYGRWHKWDGLWTERNEKKVWTGGNEMKHKQWSR